MSFPNRSTTYDEAISDLKRKLQQQEHKLLANSTQSNSNSNASSINKVDFYLPDDQEEASTCVNEREEENSPGIPSNHEDEDDDEEVSWHMIVSIKLLIQYLCKDNLRSSEKKTNNVILRLFYKLLLYT